MKTWLVAAAVAALVMGCSDGAEDSPLVQPLATVATTTTAMDTTTSEVGTTTTEEPPPPASDGITGETITIGIKFDQPGLGLMRDGNPTGFDVDVARHIAAELGFHQSRIIWQEAPTPQREELLETGGVDFIAATYSISDERHQRVDFAGPYLVAGQDLLIRADDTINGPADLTGRRLCSVMGSTPAVRVKDNHPGVELVEYDTYALCMEALAEGAVDAVTADDTILAGYASHPEWAGPFRVVGNPFTEEYYGIGVGRDSGLCEEINEIIVAMWADGTMDRIVARHFGPAGYTLSAINPPSPGGWCS